MSTGDLRLGAILEFKACTQSDIIDINESEYFTPKPATADVVPAPLNKTIEVLHLSIGILIRGTALAPKRTALNIFATDLILLIPI